MLTTNLPCGCEPFSTYFVNSVGVSIKILYLQIRDEKKMKIKLITLNKNTENVSTPVFKIVNTVKKERPLHEE